MLFYFKVFLYIVKLSLLCRSSNILKKLLPKYPNVFFNQIIFGKQRLCLTILSVFKIRPNNDN